MVRETKYMPFCPVCLETYDTYNVKIYTHAGTDDITHHACFICLREIGRECLSSCPSCDGTTPIHLVIENMKNIKINYNTEKCLTDPTLNYVLYLDDVYLGINRKMHNIIQNTLIY